jgi:hypothetical protein
MTLEVKYTKEFNFEKLKKYKFVIPLLLATAVAAYSNTLDISEPPLDPIVINVPGPTEDVHVPGPIPDPIIITPECPDPIICDDPIVCDDPIICEKCPESPLITEPEQPDWYLGGNGDDDTNGNDTNGNDTNGNDDTDDNGDDDNGDDDGDDSCDGHGSSQGGHGGHGQGHGHGHNK